MKIIHTADLHIGKRLNDISLIDDQVFILDSIVDLAREESADAIFIAGDIYDRSTPSAEAMTVFDGFISKLSDLGVKVFAISGNHDSDQRIEYFSSLLDRSGVYLAGRFEGRLRSVHFTSGDESVTVDMLPFVKPQTVKYYFPEETVETYTDAVRLALSTKCDCPTGVRLLIAHQFVTGATLSDSEELAVGGLDDVPASVFDGYDFVALGHIHTPQSAGGDRIRYSGSPLKYSVSEAARGKSVTVIEIQGETVTHRVRPLVPKRDLREIRCYLKDIEKMDYSEDFVKITLLDDLFVPDARVTASVTFPNIIKFSLEQSAIGDCSDAEMSCEKKSSEDMFYDFYYFSVGERPTDEMMAAVRSALNKEVETE